MIGRISIGGVCVYGLYVLLNNRDCRVWLYFFILVKGLKLGGFNIESKILKLVIY